MQKILSRCSTAIAGRAIRPVLPVCSRPFSGTPSDGKFNINEINKTVFADDSTFSLVNKYLVYQMCRFPFVIKNAQKITDVFYKVFGNPQSSIP